jgi:hypothetical protein
MRKFHNDYQVKNLKKQEEEKKLEEEEQKHGEPKQSVSQAAD